MKKSAVISLAVSAALVSAFAFSACGEKVTWDKDASAFGSEADVTFNVKAKKANGEEGKISDTLFGVFLEDINFASYYLDDDLISNSSFETITSTWNYNWSVINSKTTTFTQMNDGNGILSNVAEYNAKGVNSKYAKVTVNSSGAGGIKNTGYDAVHLAVENGTDYVFSAFIKNTNAAFDLEVAVTNGTTDYLKGTINVKQSDEWIKYTRTFKAEDTQDKSLSFEMRMPAGTEIYLDGVSLETTESTCGIKNKPYTAIKELAPKFIRFPGGCIIEGYSGDDRAYDWKNSIGAVQNGTNAGDDVVPAFTYKQDTNGTAQTVTTYGEAVTRTANPDIWGYLNGGSWARYYDMTYSIGFYEYFLLCDSLGASAVPVVNCGKACQGQLVDGVNGSELKGRHDKYVADYIQDAIDLIEFAKGGTDTKWGAVRASLGHPAPFEMSYIGIGNEQWGDYYTKYYEKFLENQAFMDALSQYSVKPIVGNCTMFSHCEQINDQGITTNEGVAQHAANAYVNTTSSKRLINTVNEYGVVDQHYYVNYTDLLTNTHMYDNYLRSYDDPDKYYEVFVGEYSANTATTDYTYNLNQWITALSEAAMMTGYERNGDIVKLAAYAPMFGTARDVGENSASPNQWATDMMYFTNSDLVLTANYYVQQLFMKNQGAFRILDDNITVEWKDDLSPTFELVGDKANSKAKTEVDKLYYVVSLAENGDVIIKVVNVSDETIKADFKISDKKLKGNASVTVLQCDDKGAKNTLNETPVSPESYKIGAFTDSTIGYEIKPNSVTCITVHTK